MEPFEIGDEVLGPWHDDGFYYPGVIVTLDEGAATAHLAFLDGDEADVAVDRIRHGVLGPGVTAQVNWRGRGTYFTGTVIRRLGAALEMAYEDGERSWTSIALCRVRESVLEALPPDTAACTYCGGSLATDRRSCRDCGAPRPGRRS